LYTITGSQTEAKAVERYNARIIGGEHAIPAEKYVVCSFMFLSFMK
jgi:hypothetical protein